MHRRSHARALPAGVVAPSGTPARDLASLRHTLDNALAAGTRSALFFATGVVVLGAIVSLLIPRIRVESLSRRDALLEDVESLGPLSGTGTVALRRRGTFRAAARRRMGDLASVE